MKTLDRYVLRNFIVSALLCFVVLMSLRVVADLFVNMDEFTEKTAGQQEKSFKQIAGEISTYYGYQSLVYFRELGGIIIVAAAAFTLARMNHTNELTAILASGVSLQRVLLPILLGAVALNVLVIIDTEFLIPPNEHRLVRSRDDVEGKDTFQVPLLTDCNDSAWYSRRFWPAEKRLVNPFVMLRDDSLAHCGYITGPSASYDGEEKTWVFTPGEPSAPGGAPVPARLHLAGATVATTTDFVPTKCGPAKVVEYIRGLNKPQNANVNWSKIEQINEIEVEDGKQRLTISAGRLVFETPGDYASAILVGACFTYPLAQRSPVRFTAPRASFGYNEKVKALGWSLREGRLTYSCELDPTVLALRRSGDRLKYMSTSGIGRLLKLRRVSNLAAVRLARHARFAGFFNNIIMLLVAVPFILSRERNIKSSAGMTVLMVGLVYVFIFVTQNAEDLNPVLAAWLPLLVFGPVSAVMLDAIKT